MFPPIVSYVLLTTNQSPIHRSMAVGQKMVAMRELIIHTEALKLLEDTVHAA